MISFDLASWIDILNKFPILISIFPAIIGGEAAIIGLSFLSQQGLVRLDYVIVFGLVGTILSDFLWFALTKTRMIQKMKEWKKIKHHYLNLEKKVESASHKRDFWIILIAKFIVGTRAVTILFLSMRKIKFGKFAFFTIISNIVWVAVMVGVGVLAGRGFATLGFFENVQYVITGIIVLLIAWHFVEKWITKRFFGKVQNF